VLAEAMATAAPAAAEDTNENMEKEMDANAWTREEHYHFLKVRPLVSRHGRPPHASPSHRHFPPRTDAHGRAACVPKGFRSLGFSRRSPQLAVRARARA